MVRGVKRPMKSVRIAVRDRPIAATWKEKIDVSLVLFFDKKAIPLLTDTTCEEARIAVFLSVRENACVI